MNRRNVSIQLIRIIAMFMIIIDHLLMGIEFPLKSLVIQVANSGTFIFLLLSGFLFSKKQVDDWKRWFINRIIRICIPMWIFMAIDFIAEYILWNQFDIKYVFIYLFNLQGILGVNYVGSSLWFLTLIMICYLITPILQWIKNKNPNRILALLSVACAILLQIILAYTTNIGMVAGHTLSWCVIAIGMYVVGYFVGNSILSDKIDKKRIIVLSVLMIISSSIVMLFNQKFDGQVIYDKIVICYGMIFVDLWLCTILYKIGTYIKGKIITKIINHLDIISYEFYIVHGLIIAILADVLIRTVGVVLYILVIILLSYVLAWVLHSICKFINSFINKEKVN